MRGEGFVWRKMVHYEGFPDMRHSLIRCRGRSFGRILLVAKGTPANQRWQVLQPYDREQVSALFVSVREISDKRHASTLHSDLDCHITLIRDNPTISLTQLDASPHPPPPHSPPPRPLHVRQPLLLQRPLHLPHAAPPLPARLRFPHPNHPLPSLCPPKPHLQPHRDRARCCPTPSEMVRKPAFHADKLRV